MRRLIYLGLACACASPALAQSTPGDTSLPSAEDLAKRDTVTLALGVAVLPDYVGSDDYRLIPAAAIRGKLGGIAFSSRGSYLYVDVVPHSGKLELNAGPIIGLRFNGRRHIADPVVKLLPQTKTAIEAGGFVGVTAHGLTNPYDALSLRLDVLHDVGSAHQSTTFSPNVEFSTP